MYILSYSSLVMYKKCPAMFKYWLDGTLIEAKKPYAVAGKCWHKVLELLGGRDFNKNRVLEIFEMEWKKNKNNFYSKREDRELHERYTKSSIIRNVLDILEWLKDGKILLKEFGFIMNINEEYKITGFIDLIKDGYIYDYKFTKSKTNDALQLYIYYKVAKEIGMDIKGVGFINGLTGKKKMIDNIEDYKKEYDDIIDRLLNDKVFEATPSYDSCKWCNYKKLCKFKNRGGKKWILKI